MSLKGKKQAFKVARGEDGETTLQDYEITLDEGMVVLDCMHRIQHEKEPDMAVRWNCKQENVVLALLKSTGDLG